MEKTASKHRSGYLIASIIILIILGVFVNRTYFKPPVPLESSTVPVESVSPEIMAIIRNAENWIAVGPEFYGKPAPELQLTDIDGKMHNLSDYRGKEVLVIFWATWCPPCNAEVPGLIELRKTNPADKLQMLAISSEEAGIETVRKFVENKKINYTAIWTQHSKLPIPFVHAIDLPTAFFIDKQGNFKLITTGLMDEKSVQAIIDTKLQQKP